PQDGASQAVNVRVDGCISLGRELANAIRRDGHGRAVLTQQAGESLTVDCCTRTEEDPSPRYYFAHRFKQVDCGDCVPVEVSSRIPDRIWNDSMASEVENILEAPCRQVRPNLLASEIDLQH